MEKKTATMLTEGDLKKIIKEAVTRVISEDIYMSQNQIIDKFYEMRDTIGDKVIVDALVGFLGTDNLQSFMKHLERNWGVGDYADNDDEIGEGEF